MAGVSTGGSGKHGSSFEIPSHQFHTKHTTQHLDSCVNSLAEIGCLSQGGPQPHAVDGCAVSVLYVVLTVHLTMIMGKTTPSHMLRIVKLHRPVMDVHLITALCYFLSTPDLSGGVGWYRGTLRGSANNRKTPNTTPSSLCASPRALSIPLRRNLTLKAGAAYHASI